MLSLRRSSSTLSWQQQGDPTQEKQSRLYVFFCDFYQIIVPWLIYREQRFERVTKNLKVARVFNTLVEEMKAMGIASVDDSECTEVMAPVAHKDRSPVLLLMGGGMGAGKSTVLKEILKE